MNADEQRSGDDAAAQDDRRELEVLLALAASEFAGRNRRVQSEVARKADSAPSIVSRA